MRQKTINGGSSVLCKSPKKAKHNIEGTIPTIRFSSISDKRHRTT